MKTPLKGFLMTGVALTHLHPGAGRSPGVVDLPVMRDNLGYPIVMASSIKGALKTLCFRESRNTDKKDCMCLFGGEPGEGDKGAGAISILDLSILAMPIASASHGFLYVTTHSLLARAAAISAAVDSKLSGVFSRILEAARNTEVLGVGLRGNVYLQMTPVPVEEYPNSDLNELVELSKKLGGVNPLASHLVDRLVILEDSLGVSIIDKGLVRVTRIRLNRETKTTGPDGGLWTEEYIPQGTIFLTAVIYNGISNSFCDDLGIDSPEGIIDRVKEKIKDDLPVFIGGKETIGKGLIIFKKLEADGR